MARIGLVLGAGGSVGLAFHGGVLDAISHATGWDPRTASVVVGTSAGSLTAALLRAGLPAGDLAAISEDRPLSPAGEVLRRGSPLHNPRVSLGAFLKTRPFADPRAIVEGLLRPWKRRPAALAAALLPAGAISTDAISSGLDAFYGARWPELPTWLCAVRLSDGRRIPFGRPGSPPATVGAAVAASCAIPGYFTPVRIGGARYVDGGVRSMLNLPLVREMDLDLVIVSAPMACASRWPSATADAPLRWLLRAQLEREAGRVRRRGIPVLALSPTQQVALAMGVNAMDGRRRATVSRLARSSTLRYLERSDAGRQIAELLSAPSAAFTPRVVGG
ncbi:patatin-like phospholipase family protein [Acidiferrimicrobium sp. IK]|uniref:patatin-like phospholipase family protein n=1 Tax=Acidiferrimicrobium sp. IK TaxID=2871700 RepID=UPI0021CB7E58|nr:patatin-like phospholipase family protein [Acidiferrimicrobium sp. IK]MCU4187506.1 patatin-like phospholipase family protein [Acidiferrimicrobium sp. IK]